MFRTEGPTSHKNANSSCKVQTHHAVLNAQCCAPPHKTVPRPQSQTEQERGRTQHRKRKRTDKAAAAAQATGTCRQPSKRSQPAGQSANKVDRQSTVKQAKGRSRQQTGQTRIPKEQNKNKLSHPLAPPTHVECWPQCTSRKRG